jgi:hypothetical protein
MITLRKKILIVGCIFLITAHHLPAPISEESPTPKPEKPASSKAKESRKPKPKPKAESIGASSAQPTPAKSPAYAGTWVGVVDWGSYGITEHTIVIPPSQNKVTITGCESGANWQASISTNGISWVTGFFRENKWTLKPNADGKTALVTVYGQSVTFKRIQ